MKINSEDVRPSENKVSHECEIIGGKVLAIKNKFGDFNKKKITWGKSRVERK
jgi:hypothetical protein